MLPPQHVVENLASWHWTLLRYAYLIEVSPIAHLATNELAGDYRNHHMTALSEAFGVGCALSYAHFWLSTQVPEGASIRDPVDFDNVLFGTPLGHAGGLSAHQAPHASRQPDYLILAEHEGAVRLLLVECKGNSSNSRSVSIEQLGSAMHQLEGIQLIASDGTQVAADRHAYATRMAKSGGQLETLAIDPPSEGSPWIKPRRLHGESPPPLEREERRRRVPAEDVGGLALARLDMAIQTWSGLAAVGTDVDLGVKRLESDFGDISGTTSVLELPNGRKVEVFTGAVLEPLEATRQQDFERAREHRGRLRRALREAPASSRQARDDWPQRWRATAPLRSDDDPERVTSAVGEDGTALQIKVQ